MFVVLLFKETSPMKMTILFSFKKHTFQLIFCKHKGLYMLDNYLSCGVWIYTGHLINFSNLESE